MEELYEILRARFSKLLIDGRAITLGLDSAGHRLVIEASGDCRPEWIATVVVEADGYAVLIPCRSADRYKSREEVIELIDDLTRPYSNVCWNCHQPLVLTPDNRCPKCRRFVHCACGMCLCDNPEVSIRPAPKREPLDPERIKDLNKRYGHLFRKPSP
jgi:hypothetical protein